VTAAAGGFCVHCGAAAPEAICTRCGNNRAPAPKVLVACFVFQGERLLWMRRACAPQAGFWAIPAGFMELGESLAEAAARELREETGLVLDPAELRLYSLGSITQIDQVYIAFRATVGEVEWRPGAEALDVRFFAEHELPWSEIAFPGANYSIQMAYDDIRRGSHGLYLARHERGELSDQFARGSV
jgi:ADP-ribose pyrophosphatase YjhB (NUDIX family)